MVWARWSKREIVRYSTKWLHFPPWSRRWWCSRRHETSWKWSLPEIFLIPLHILLSARQSRSKLVEIPMSIALLRKTKLFPVLTNRLKPPSRRWQMRTKTIWATTSRRTMFPTMLHTLLKVTHVMVHIKRALTLTMFGTTLMFSLLQKKSTFQETKWSKFYPTTHHHPTDSSRISVQSLRRPTKACKRWTTQSTSAPLRTKIKAQTW